MFRLEFETANAAFEGDPATEIAEILQGVSARVRDGFVDSLSHPIRDSNGNAIGTWQYSE